MEATAGRRGPPGSGAAWICLLASLLACESYDPSLLKRADGLGPNPVPGAADAGQPRMDAGLPTPCSGATAERCNDRDDDCDGRTDEEAAASCAFEHARGACASGGICALVECDSDFFDCNGSKQDGCETPLAEVACGECSRVCSDAGAGPDEDAGCVPEPDGELCDDRDNDCDNAVDEGLLNSIEHCGSCGATCERDNGVTSCQSGACELVGCEVGFADCDRDPDNGCEPEPCTPEQRCLALEPTARGASCDACVCQAQTCVDETLRCANDALCLALITCYAENDCGECGGSSSMGCTDCYDSGNGPCAAELNLAAGGSDGNDTSGVTAGNCSGDPATQPCAAAIAFADCRNTNCGAECP